MSAPSAATSATRIDARDMAWTKASRAGSATAALIRTAAPSDSRAAAATGRGTPAGKPVGEAARIQRGHEAPDDGDPQGAAELAGRVVDRGADVRPVGWERCSDRFGGGRPREAHAGAHEDEGDREAAVARVQTDRGGDGEAGENSAMPVVATRRVPNRATSAGRPPRT